MSTRKILFIVLPLLLLLNSIISYVLFQSSYRVNESYNTMLTRVLLYQQVDEQVQLQVNYISQYTDQKDSSILLQLNNNEQLSSLQAQLQQQPIDRKLLLGVTSYRNLLSSYMSSENTLMLMLDQDSSLAYVDYYNEIKQLSSFISEESYNLISKELSIYSGLYQTIMLEISDMKQSGIYLLIATTLLSLLLAYWISSLITKPIQQLVSVAEKISHGELTATLPRYSPNSEFYILSDALEQMKMNLMKIMDSDKEALQKDKQLREYEIAVLQNQINPHFLFNSLNVLSKLALIEGAEQTSDLTVTMANLLRYHLRQMDKPVPLRDEVKHAKDYFYIQQTRFRDRVHFIIDIDEEELTTRVPVLTLQPILENIFMHGIEGMESGATITLHIYGDKTYTWIEISDNGSGMDEQTKLNLLNYDSPSEIPLSSEQKKGSTGIGSRNVFRRLQLIYGQQHAVYIDSTIGVGTTIKLRIPKQQELKLTK
ncbi:sensor histidine kinase [Paenibacillus endoradicis]|uniref:sensor histidine kinase n=1 Tax=Paenibacillus endoradicis TaxID=2972487 RepID=UPI0021599576|nr:histidine kinase [Paenibacillus endoradicis]MCR8658820.1 histidine kinase [Paenibacillus endoradicis]